MLLTLQSDGLAEYDRHKFLKPLEALHRIHTQLWPAIHQSAPPTPNLHCFEPGGEVWINRHNHKTLEPHGKGPRTVILTMPMAVKTDGIRTWIHQSHIKPDEKEPTQKLRPFGKDFQTNQHKSKGRSHHTL